MPSAGRANGQLTQVAKSQSPHLIETVVAVALYSYPDHPWEIWEMKTCACSATRSRCPRLFLATSCLHYTC
ncbi:hypothetical protein BRADI_3g09585v3 [Brachypodium distachyon]|uniref:Uncharacterized protein n=1 Tax=Brachypodium distachyon TaxID=15368 RepID=A0A2K2CW71_BRADI|nr:hypothetical protein BRADI_3g09585v3 [Brachypodium distachyon]